MKEKNFMPTYTYRKKSDYNPDPTSKEITETYIGTWDSYNKFLEENPEYENVLLYTKNAKAHIDPVTVGRQKIDRGFNDVLKEIKKSAGKTSTVKTYY